jgi:aminoglycoside phosphotransferase (APT) family kinase protein
MSWAELAALAAAKGAGWAPLLAAAVPALTGLEALGDGAAATSEPVLCHNNLNPGNVLLGPGEQPIVTGWEHANGLPPEWELSAALASWAVNPNGGINAAGARALLAGYERQAGSLPALSLDTFRGAATGLQNYVAGQVGWALSATSMNEQRYADLSVRHLLTHLPSVEIYGRVLDAALTG